MPDAETNSIDQVIRAALDLATAIARHRHWISFKRRFPKTAEAAYNCNLHALLGLVRSPPNEPSGIATIISNLRLMADLLEHFEARQSSVQC
jgi:hypothetical protein